MAMRARRVECLTPSAASGHTVSMKHVTLRTLVCFVGVVWLTGCVRLVGVDDVLRPDLSSSSFISLTIDDVVVFKDNVATAAAWAGSGVVRTQGVLQTPSGAVSYRLARRAEADVPLVIYCGGSTFATPQHGDYVLWLIARFGDGVVWDYPGFGGSDGEPDIASLEAASAHMASQIARFQRSPDQPVLIWGHSFGGFVCSDLVRRAKGVSAMVFETSAGSATNAIRAGAPWFAKPFVDADPEVRSFSSARAGEVDVPFLVLAAGQDRVLPPRLSDNLRDELERQGRDVTYHVFDDADHVTIPFAADFDAVMSAFLTQAGLPVALLPRARARSVTFTINVYGD